MSFSDRKLKSCTWKWVFVTYFQKLKGLSEILFLRNMSKWHMSKWHRSNDGGQGSKLMWAAIPFSLAQIQRGAEAGRRLIALSRMIKDLLNIQ